MQGLGPAAQSPLGPSPPASARGMGSLLPNSRHSLAGPQGVLAIAVSERTIRLESPHASPLGHIRSALFTPHLVVSEGRPEPAVSEPPTGSSGPNRQVEQAWRRSHEETLRGYVGQWVVLEGEELVAHGPDPAKAVAAARVRGIRIPYVFYVESLGKNVAAIGL